MIGRPVAALALFILCLHLALGYSHNYLVGADDDRLWLFASGARVGQEDTGRSIDALVRRGVIDARAGVSRLTRIDLRAAYYRNYAAATRVYALAAAVVRRATDDLWRRDYPAYLARAMFAGFVSMYVVTCLLLVAALVLVRDRRWAVAITAAIALIALLETIFDLTGDTWSGLPILLPDAQTDERFWDNFWPNLPALFINPEIQLSPFGDTPRNHFNLLTVAVFALRWQGAYTASYALLAALSFLHQSHTALLFAFVAAADVVLRPELFRTRTTLPMVAVVLTFVSRESLGAIVGVARPAVIAVIVVAVLSFCAVIWLGLSSNVVMPARAWLDRWRTTLLSHGSIAADLLVIGFLWVVTFPVVAAINTVGTEQQSQYFWTQVHGRALGLLRPPLIVGLMFLWLERLAARGKALVWTSAVILSAVALLPSAYLAAQHDRSPIARLEHDARVLDQSIGSDVDWRALGGSTEQAIYYAQARTIDRARK